MLVVAVGCIAALGCAGDAGSFDRDPVGPKDARLSAERSGDGASRDAKTADGASRDSAPSEGGASEGGANCSTTGVKASCDPVKLTGCAKGQCYIVRGAGAACVCPAGSNGLDQPCNTTTACAPGHVCAGTTAPGTCRRACDPTAPNCATGLTCTPVNQLPMFGFCEPPRDGGA